MSGQERWTRGLVHVVLAMRCRGCGHGLARASLGRASQGPKRNVALFAHLRIVIAAQSRHRVGGLECALDRLNLRRGGGANSFNPRRKIAKATTDGRTDTPF